MNSPRNDILAALQGGRPDRVVWGEMDSNNRLKQALAVEIPLKLSGKRAP